MRAVMILAAILAFVLTLDAHDVLHSPFALTEPYPATRLAGCVAIDGDTIRCAEQRVRLLGSDAAELPGHCRSGRDCAPGDPLAQKRALARLVGGDLIIRPIKFDRYGRIVGVVETVDGLNLSCAMIGIGVQYRPDWDDGRRIFWACPTQAGITRP